MNNGNNNGNINSENMKGLWRPAIAWLYIAICFVDFMVFPILWNAAQIAFLKSIVITPWNPLTLQGGGLFHISMGAILGVTAYGRTQEKINGSHITSSTVISPSIQPQTSKPPTAPMPVRD